MEGRANYDNIANMIQSKKHFNYVFHVVRMIRL